MSERGAFAGMLTIVRFNAPWYLGVAFALLLAGVILLTVDGPVWMIVGAWSVLAASVWFLIGSLGAAHWIYDRSDLHRFGWLQRGLAGHAAAPGARFVVCHAGYDECSSELRARVPAGEWRLLDHFDPSTMREPSIQRARRSNPPSPGSIAAPHAAWPVPDAWADGVFAVLAIHELRGDAERVAWFREARRCLVPGGRVLLVEHLRDIANFLAFGPGFMHFHSLATWRRAWTAAGLDVVDVFGLTPFLRVCVLRPRADAAPLTPEVAAGRSGRGTP